jgi:hypothetical protein
MAPFWRAKSNQSRIGTKLGLGKEPIVVVSRGLNMANLVLIESKKIEVQ